jgi:glycine/D-amino acid oxidase-like deaminating enzyme
MVDAVIAGAGIAGVATAWRLAERLGRTDAILVDPLPPLSVTSNRPEANYRDWWPQRAMAHLADRSLALVDWLLADGAAIPMDQRGYLYVTKDRARAASFPETVAARERDGVPGGGVDVLDAIAIRRTWPHLAPAIAGGIHVRRAGGIDTVALGRAMLERARAAGVTVERGSVVGVHAPHGRVTEVDISTPSGRHRIATDRFVNAAGPFALPLLDLVGARLPIETVLRQKVVVADSRGVVPRDAPFTITLDRQRLAEDREELPGGIHVKPDDSLGPDRLKLGWAWDQRPSTPRVDPACPPAFPGMVVRGAAAWIPGLGTDAAAPILAHEGGFYARVPDGQPVIGPLGPEGSFIAGAMAGFGAMMAAAAGDIAAAWLVGDRPTEQMQAFSPARFTDDAYLAEIAAGRIATGEL